MFELSRTIRFCIDFAGSADPADRSGSPGMHNTYAGSPSLCGLGAYYELEVRVRGESDPVTGYLVNISAIDDAVRETAIPLLQRTIRTTPDRDPATLLPELLQLLQEPLQHGIVLLRWKLTPYYWIAIRADAMDRVILNQHFDFAAAHRLHSPALSEQDNLALFGLCNNPNGHGHNYRLQVEASTMIEPSPDGGAFNLPVLERIVDERIVKRFDHKHLNLDTEEFAELNPSVEHIARICHELLLGPIEAAGGRLERVTVWETDRTSCSYPA